MGARGTTTNQKAKQQDRTIFCFFGVGAGLYGGHSHPTAAPPRWTPGQQRSHMIQQRTWNPRASGTGGRPVFLDGAKSARTGLDRTGPTNQARQGWANQPGGTGLGKATKLDRDEQDLKCCYGVRHPRPQGPQDLERRREVRILDLKCCYGVRPGLKNKTGLHSFGFSPFSRPSRQRELSPEPRLLG